MKTRAIYAVIITGLALLLFAALDSAATEVKWCFNPFTQETFAVKANQPCPYPSHDA